MTHNYKHGEIVWRDLTVPNTEAVKNFYENVVGWKTSLHEMGDYSDYNVHVKASDEVISGIIHKRGVNDDLPPVWLNYIYVDSVQKALEDCLTSGGEILVPLRKIGDMDFAVLKDPAQAIFAVIGDGQ